MSWLSVTVRPGAGREAVLAALFAAGSSGVQEEGETLVTHFPPGTSADPIRAAVERASPDAEVAIGRTPDVDWSVAWREGMRAHDLGALTIAPPWLADGRDPERTVVIDPGMAFGTGDHPTTRGAVRLMQRAVRPGDRVADLGAGSAVLSIAAAKLGAAWVAAIELDAQATPDAERNVRRNGVAAQVRVLEGDAAVLLPLVAPARLVLANIVSSVLVSLLPAVSAALTADGQAILSGILLEERGVVLDAIGAGGWRVEGDDREDAWWSALIARR